MSRKISLASLLKNLYAENSGFDVGPPVQVLKELENNVLVLADTEISDDDVPLLAKFFSHSQTCKQIKRIQIDRSSSKKAYVRRPDSAFSANGCRLLRELFKFIGNAKSLQCICFESLDIPYETLPLLGKALVASPSPIHWLGFKDCNIQGDAGLRVLTHYIGQLAVQVLAIEQCGLTDASLGYIASILKAQQNNLDSLYWNATLRVDPSKRGNLWNAEEIDSVYRRGLVALSLFGNHFEGKDMFVLTRVLRHNHWLLGLNLANNQITRENMLILTEELLANNVMQTLLLKNNPGLDSHIAHVMLAAIERNRTELSVDVTQDVVEHLEARHASGRRRLEVQTPRIAALLRTWQQLQAEEVSAPHSLIQPSKHSGAASTTSAATTGTTSNRADSSRRSPGKTRGAVAPMPLAPETVPAPATRRAAQAEMQAQRTRPYGYSALDIVSDRQYSAPSSPRRPGSPSARAKNTSLFSNSSFGNASQLRSSAANGNAAKHSQRVDTQSGYNYAAGGGVVDPDAPTARFVMQDFDRLTGRVLGWDAGSDDDSANSSVGAPEDIIAAPAKRGTASATSNQAYGHQEDHDDVLDHAVPMVSPVRKEAIDGALAQVRAELQAQTKDGFDGLMVPEVGESWGNVEWPVSEDAFDHPDPEGRPPSRISIRHRGGVTGRSSPSPTQQQLLHTQRSLDEEYRRLLQQLQDAPHYQLPVTDHSVRSLSGSCLERPSRRRSPLRASRESTGVSSKPFPPTKPFYAGGHVSAVSPQRPTMATISNAELAALYGPGRGIGRPTADAFAGYRPATAPPRKGGKTVKRVKKQRRNGGAPAVPTTAAVVRMGRAHGPHGTRIRSRSAERTERVERVEDAHYDDFAPPSAIIAPAGRHHRGTEGVSLEQSGLAHELSTTVLNATRNLETVSAKLRDVIDTLSTSMELNVSLQREMLSASMLNTSATPGGHTHTHGHGHGLSDSINASRASWMSPAVSHRGASGETPSSSHGHGRSGQRGIAESPLLSTVFSASKSQRHPGQDQGHATGAPAQRYREYSVSPASYAEAMDAVANHHALPVPQQQQVQVPVQEAALDSQALADLVRSRMEMKLRAMFDVSDQPDRA